MNPSDKHKKGLQNLPTYEPDPSVWDRVEASLTNKKKRPLGLYWKLGLAASVVLLIGLIYILNFGDENQLSESGEQTGRNPYQTETILVEDRELSEADVVIPVEKPKHSGQDEVTTQGAGDSTITVTLSDTQFRRSYFTGTVQDNANANTITTNSYNWTFGDANVTSAPQPTLNYSASQLQGVVGSSKEIFKNNSGYYSIDPPGADDYYHSDNNLRLWKLEDGYANGQELQKPISQGFRTVEPYVGRKSLDPKGSFSADTVLLYGLNDYTSESYAPLIENRFKSPQKDPLSTFGIDVDNASYSVMRTKLNMGFPVPKDAVRVEEFINYFNYNYPQPTKGHPFSVNLESAECPWDSKHQLVRIGLKGKDIEYDKAEPSNLVFLIDVSGSMDEENKLPLVKKSMQLLVDQMSDQDRIAIVTYAGSTGLAMESTSCSETNKEKIKRKIKNFEAGGSTAGGQGIQLAYEVASKNLLKEGNNRVILCTDGDFNVGQSSDQAMKQLIQTKRDENIFITVCGFGMGNYKDSKMEVIADNGNGNYFYIDTYKESTRVFERDLRATLFTIAKDVKIQVEFNPSQVKAYRLIGYENRLMPPQDFNDDTKDGGELGAGHTVTALYEIIPAGSDEKVDGLTELKYQTPTTGTSKFKDELFTVKLRYKEPKGTKSKLLETSLLVNNGKFSQASADFRLAAGVAYYAQQLRQSDFVSSRNFNDSKRIIQASRQNPDDDLTELIQLIDKASEIYQIHTEKE